MSCCRLTSSPPGGAPSSRHRAGFVLPIAIASSSILLLSSLSLHTLALQARHRARQQWQTAQRRDALHSAVMHFAQRSRGAESCLLALPSEQWLAQAKSVCPAANPTLLRSGAVEGLRWRLKQWTPTMPSAQMPSAQLRLALPDLEMEASVPLRFSAAGVLRFERVLS